MAKRDRAAYMRGYRARRREQVETVMENLDQIAPGGGQRFASLRIQELEDEVRHLKAELAKRPEATPTHAFNTRPFTPVPKTRK